jgi:NitT/TauT family transport system substrate-binding protein
MRQSSISRSLSLAPILRTLLVAAATFVLSAPVTVQAQTKVRYEEVVRSVLYVPMYVALNQGYFKENGLDIAMKTSQGADKGMAALLSDSADIVLIGPEATIYVANSESPVKPKIFSGLTATDGFLLLSRAPVEKFTWSMLKGKKVMSFRPGSAPDVFLEAAMRKNGIDPGKDLKLVNNISPAARTGAWIAGQNDFGIFLEPEASNLETSGSGHVVASIGQEVGQVDFTVFTSTDAYLQKNPAVAQGWVNAIAKAQKYVDRAPAADLARHIAEFFPGITQPELVRTVERYRKLHLWKTNPLVQEAAIESIQDMLIASGQLDKAKRVKYERVVIPTFANAAK